MLRSLTSAVSGLRNFNVQLDVLGNNLANIRTLGFKGNRVTFAEARGQALTGQQQVGLGMNVSGTDLDFTQGNLEFTGSPTDLAIQGNSFFILSDGERNRYTRAGNFYFNNDHKLVNPSGLAVQGWRAVEGEIDTLSPLTDIILNPAEEISEPIQTRNVFLSGNLDATLVPRGQELSLASPLTVNNQIVTDPAIDLSTLDQLTGTLNTIDISGSLPDGTVVSGTFTYGVIGTTVGDLVSFIDGLYDPGDVRVEFDNVAGKIVLTDEVQDGRLKLTGEDLSKTQTSISLAMTETVGSESVVTDLPFRKTVEGFTGTVDTSTVIYDVNGNAYNLVITFTNTEKPGIWNWKAELSGTDKASVDPTRDEGTIRFSEAGEVLSFRGEVDLPEVTIIPDPASGANQFTVKLDVLGSDSFAGVNQFAANKTLHVSRQDGRELGTMRRFTFDTGGNIVAEYTNDDTEILYQLALTEFPNPVGLYRSGDALYEVTTNSGVPSRGAAGQKFASSIVLGSLEMSNVDLVRQFTDMITTQRGFQASARVVTTADAVLEETMRLKR